MAVDVTFTGSGSSLVTAYTDSLLLADPAMGAGSLGKNWSIGSSPKLAVGDPVDSAIASIGASSKDAVNAWIWNPFGSQNPTQFWRAWGLPMPSFMGTYGKTQFVQCTCVQNNGTAGQGTLYCGLMVCFSGGSNGEALCYEFVVTSDDHTHGLIQRIGRSTATLVSGLTNADGDVLRMSADLSVGAQVTLTVTKNGTQLSQFVDNTANIIQQGSPGLFCVSATVGAGSPHNDWRTFSCGLGL